ncbi:MAG TPA: glycosyl hydrolase [Flexivirga sp.]|uniref:glycoside hydrolase 5 family protein n=1 Tax=Flexivirga sp. TaxID=1962927 RepID=UPI002B84DBFC|nr:glycosyl hydrolase [Flexivirga sp.]HWC22653.1 glycosyl hydrolase [Flexivirga sp.]
MDDQAAASRELRFGANYVPSQGWFHGWLDLDRAAVARDLDDIASLGMDHVRIFPVWPWIQPNRAHVRARAVADVRTVIQLGAERGLDVCVDLLQGHLSSFDFLPSWVLTWHQRSIFTDPDVRAGLRWYVEELVRALAPEPNVFAFTLGNEVNNLWPANATSADASREWAQDLLGAIRDNARADQLVVHSLFDDAFYAPDHPFSAADVTTLGDVSSVHSWVFNGTSRIDGPLGPATTSHAAYLARLAGACGAADRPVWLQELGAPLPDVPADAAPEFVRHTVAAAGAVSTLTGITWWCSHDIDRRLVDFPEREYDLGLFTVDHVAKPAALALRDAVEAARTADRAVPQSISLPADIVADPSARSLVAPGSAFHRAWVALGERPDGHFAPPLITPFSPE